MMLLKTMFNAHRAIAALLLLAVVHASNAVSCNSFGNIRGTTVFGKVVDLETCELACQTFHRDEAAGCKILASGEKVCAYSFDTVVQDGGSALVSCSCGTKGVLCADSVESSRRDLGEDAFDLNVDGDDDGDDDGASSTTGGTPSSSTSRSSSTMGSFGTSTADDGDGDDNSPATGGPPSSSTVSSSSNTGSSSSMTASRSPASSSSSSSSATGSSSSSRPSSTTGSSSSSSSSTSSSSTSGGIRGFGCFPSDAVVQVEGKGPLSMTDLKLGDRILVDSKGSHEKYETVYSFGHREEHQNYDFVKFTLDNNEVLEMTVDHMVINDEGRSVPAGIFHVGDLLQLANGDMAQVEVIEPSNKRGVFAPFTASGSLVVNGVKVSSYIAFQQSETVTFYSYDTGLTFQFLSHTFKAPHRMWCQVNNCLTESYTEDGISTWVRSPYRIVRWLFTPTKMGF